MTQDIGTAIYRHGDWAFNQLGYVVNLNVYNSGVRLYLGSDRSNTEYAGYTYYATVRYTKTTDGGAS